MVKETLSLNKSLYCKELLINSAMKNSNHTFLKVLAVDFIGLCCLVPNKPLLFEDWFVTNTTVVKKIL